MTRGQPTRLDDMSLGSSGDKASNSHVGYLSTSKNLWAPSMEGDPPLLQETEILIGVMGMTGVGKTSFIKQITGLDMKIGHSLASCTKEIHLATTKIGDSVVRFIDTPGFDDTHAKDSDILKTIWEYISIGVPGGLRLSGLLYLHRITDDRVGGTALKNLSMFQKLVGDYNMKNVVLLTTMWGKLQPSDDGDARVKELTETGKFWGGMITCGATHQKYDGTKEDALRIVQMMLDATNAPCKLQIQEEHDKGKNLAETSAGKEVADRLEALNAQHAQEMVEMKEQLNLVAQKGNEKVQQEVQTLYQNELQMQKEIAEAQRKLQQADIDSLNARCAELEGKGGCVVC